MSVPAYKRHLSKLEYVNTALKLCHFTITYSIKMPKRLTKFISEPLVNDSVEVYKLILKVKSIYYSKDELLINHRLVLCNEVVGILDHMNALLDIAYQSNIASISENTWSEWIELINKLNSLIYGLMNSFKSR